jgi:hypothetical protein
MRTFILYILLVATLVPTISSWGIIAHYQLNKEYIARVLCENRDKPDLHCDGKCYLAKRLKAQQDKLDKETIERVYHTPAVQLFCESDVYFIFTVHRGDPNHKSPLVNYLLSSYSAFLSSVFQPPASLV